jgi:hypothetical protein
MIQAAKLKQCTGWSRYGTPGTLLLTNIWTAAHAQKYPSEDDKVHEVKRIQRE